MEFLIYVLIAFEGILLAIAWNKFHGDVISPSIVTLTLFIVSTSSFAYCTNEWYVVFGFKSFLFFLLCFLVMLTTEYIVRNFSFNSHCKPNMKICCNQFIFSGKYENYRLTIVHSWEKILFLFFLLCFFIYIYRIYKIGISLGANSLWEAIGFNKEKGDFDGLARLVYNTLRIASYIYIVIFSHNVFTRHEHLRKNKISLTIVILTLIATFFSGQRSSAICYLFGIIVAMFIAIYKRKNFPRKKLSILIKKLILLSVSVIVIFFESANIVKGTTLERDFVSYMTYYFGSTTALMSRIVYEPELCHTPFVGYFGEKTFNGFWKFLNQIEIVDTPPTDRLWINMGSPFYPERAGNEYTFLCAPYIDFGFIGALIFVALFYFFFSYIYKKILVTENINKYVYLSSCYIFLFAMVAMTFYQDTIRSYSRPINILYIVYIIVFCKLFVRAREIKK
ncbi:O-antigen polymerase [Succinivibrio dextrinosolvens]|uniref:Oligosaccharide repeat unit polymerase n=1 Tax=Succinivibrio dextrinosolvens TaxID=83771 RepID=A0A662ZBK7_9GAMM|nr:O-antigen polymerase [Succinivibrio dextrinosolvens]SFK14582.1 oligosaccharide repeat unit polymerase [Succinivibrio dextrinosolvens]